MTSWEKNAAELRSIIEQKKEIFIKDMIESFHMTQAEIQTVVKSMK